ncbi:MAG: hypothetical protein KL863_25610 [Rhizobium sp.]|nr:hypothetical protein [Rhizobium sp.]
MTGFKPKMTPEQARRDHTRMMRFLALNALSGMALGILVTCGILYFDVAGMGSRIARSSEPLLPLLLIGFPMALIFGGAVTATAIWTMPYERLFAPEPSGRDEDEGPDAPR